MRLGLYFLPLFLVLIAVEALWFHRRRKIPYAWREVLATFGVGVGQHAMQMLALSVISGLAPWVYEHRIATVPLDTPLAILALFVGVEFVYYWFHRLSHEVRWLWATHSVHHSANQMNFAAAYRLGWTGLLSGVFLFWLPLVFLGFKPEAVFLTLGVNLVFQFFLHTDMIPKLGWLELVFNTPSHHRVHHASNIEYLDANYGGVLIVFDRWFGTLITERDDVGKIYGLTKPMTSLNPIVIALREWRDMAQDLRGAKSAREVLGYTFGAPGWRPEGGETTAELRTRLKAAGG